MRLINIFTSVKQKIAKKSLFKNLITKLISLVLIVVLSPVGIVGADTFPDNKPQSIAAKSTLHLDVQSVQPVKFDEPNRPKIVWVESQHDKTKREEEEAQKNIAQTNRNVVAREIDRSGITVNDLPEPDLQGKRALVKRAAAAYGIDWKILEAVWQVETGKSWNTPVRSYAGAQGPMQFMPGTWKAYAVDANGDGKAEINNAEDALYTGAHYLAAGGAADGNVDQALFNYNHAGWYVVKVKNIANSITD